jgi:hypothetical protein
MIFLAAAAYQWWVPAALAAGLVAWTYGAHYVMTRLIEADWRPGGEEVER